MMISFEVISALNVDDFIDILKRSTLAERRPVEDLECMQGMIAHANLILVAKEEGKIVGIARSVTDFSYCCYLSDLAVDLKYQGKGIGKALIEQTKKELLPTCKIILLSAPKARGFYPKIGFKPHPSAFVLQ